MSPVDCGPGRDRSQAGSLVRLRAVLEGDGLRFAAFFGFTETDAPELVNVTLVPKDTYFDRCFELPPVLIGRYGPPRGEADSPLFRHYTWDDATAGNRVRFVEAGTARRISACELLYQRLP